MGFALAGAVISAGTAAYSADKNRKNAHEAADSAKATADAQAAQEKQIADQQAAQAAEAQRVMAATQAANEAEQRRQQADAANSSLATNTPNVQLAANADASGVPDQRKRRATFRPDYASGINLG